ncbi:MAG: polysaccharide biosynthesis tyrosine autokinase [Xenophilus sp.]
MSSTFNIPSTVVPVTLQPVEGASDEPLRLGQMLDVLVSHRGLICGIVLACLLAGAGVVAFSQKTYETNILVQIEDSEGNSATKSFLGEAAALFDVKTPTSAEVEIIRSRAILGRAVEATQLDLVAQPRYIPVIGGWLAERATGLSKPGIFGLGGRVSGKESITVARFDVPPSLEGVPFVLVAGDKGSYTLRAGELDTELSGRVGEPLVADTGGGRLELDVSSLAGLPGAEFRLVRSRRLDAINALQRRLSLSERGKQSGVIDVALQGSDPERIAQVLNAIAAQYVRQNVERKAEEAQKTLTFLDSQLPVFKKQLEASEELYKRYRNQRGTVAFEEEAKLILETAVDRQTKLLEAQQKRRELESKFTSQHPQMQMLDAQIAALQADIGGIQSRIKTLPGIQQDAVRMERDVKVSTALYQSLLSQALQLRLVKEGKVGNARLLDSAPVPSWPIKPRKPLILALALFTGLLLGVIAAFVRNGLTEQRIKDPDRLEDDIGLPVFSTIPQSALQAGVAARRLTGPTGARLVALETPEDPAVESLRNLRTAMQFAMLGASNNRVLMSSPAPGAGQSFVAANFAALMAMAGKRTLLIDADLRRGHVHQYFGLQRHGGLSELIAGSLTIQQTVHRHVVDQLDFLATGQLPPNPAELLTSSAFKEVLERLSDLYDLVIIDSPPVLVASDAATIASHSGTVLIVARAGVSTMGELRESTRRLALSGKSATGVLLNAVEVRKGGLGHYKYGRYRYTNYNYESILPEEQ